MVRVAGHDVATQHVRGPAAELDAARRLHAVADGEDHVEVVVLDLADNLSGALSLNCRNFCDSSILGPGKLLAQCIGDVLADGLDVASKEGRELRAAQPHVLALRIEHYRQLDRPIRRLKQYDALLRAHTYLRSPVSSVEQMYGMDRTIITSTVRASGVARL